MDPVIQYTAAKPSTIRKCRTRGLFIAVHENSSLKFIIKQEMYM